MRNGVRLVVLALLFASGTVWAATQVEDFSDAILGSVWLSGDVWGGSQSESFVIDNGTARFHKTGTTAAFTDFLTMALSGKDNRLAPPWTVEYTVPYTADLQEHGGYLVNRLWKTGEPVMDWVTVSRWDNVLCVYGPGSQLLYSWNASSVSSLKVKFALAVSGLTVYAAADGAAYDAGKALAWQSSVTASTIIGINIGAWDFYGPTPGPFDIRIDDLTITADSLPEQPSTDHPRWNPPIPPAPGKNMVQNSGFEAGPDGWSSLGQTTAWGGDLSGLYGTVQSGSAYDGSHCLRIDLGPGLTPVTYFDGWPAAHTTQAAPLAATVGWYPVTPGASLTLSAYMKADRAGVPARLVFRFGTDPSSWPWPSERAKTVTLTQNWARYTYSVTADEPDVFVAVGPNLTATPNASASVWIDAVQLEVGATATAYAPREAVEIGLDTERYGNIFLSGETVQATVYGANTSGATAAVTVEARVEDYFGRSLPPSSATFTLPAHGTAETQLPLRTNGAGCYRGTVSWVAGGVTHTRDLKYVLVDEYPYDDSPFGINHAPTTPEQCIALKRGGVVWARDWSVNWEFVEPVQGSVSFAEQDLHINRVLDTGMQVMSVLPANPSTNWASEAPDSVEASMWYRLAYAPKNPQLLYGFIGKAAARYRDRVKHWEFLNEPLWVPDFCLPASAGYTVADYIELLQGAYTAMKAADPTCKVIGGLSIEAMMALGDNFIRAGGLNYADIYNLHPYPDPGKSAPEVQAGQLQRILGLMDSYGGRKPIWGTETGYYAADDRPWTPWVAPPGHHSAPILLDSERQAGDFMARQAAIMVANGVEKIFYHQGNEGEVNNGSWNLDDPLLGREGAPYKAYAAIAGLANVLGASPQAAGSLAKPSSIGGVSTSGVYGYAFQCGAKAVLVAWVTEAVSASWALDVPAGARVQNVVGAELTADPVPLSTSPIYLSTTSMTAVSLAGSVPLVAGPWLKEEYFGSDALGGYWVKNAGFSTGAESDITIEDGVCRFATASTAGYVTAALANFNSKTDHRVVPGFTFQFSLPRPSDLPDGGAFVNVRYYENSAGELPGVLVRRSGGNLVVGAFGSTVFTSYPATAVQYLTLRLAADVTGLKVYSSVNGGGFAEVGALPWGGLTASSRVGILIQGNSLWEGVTPGPFSIAIDDLVLTNGTIENWSGGCEGEGEGECEGEGEGEGAPVAQDDGYTVAEGGTKNVPAPGVLANDTDADGDPLTAVKVTGPAHGALTLNADGSFVYVHDGSESLSDSFTYQASDGTAQSNVATVILTITPVNDAPVAVADGYTVAEGGTKNVPAPGVLANDTDVDGDPLAAVKVAGPAHGALTLNADGSFVYVHDGSETLSDSFTYLASDRKTQSNIATVTLTITPVNDVPVADAGADQTAYMTDAVVLDGSASYDMDGDPLTFAWSFVSRPAGSAAVLEGADTVHPAFVVDRAGEYVVQLIVDDGVAKVASAPDTVVISTLNSAPVADAGPDQTMYVTDIVVLDGSGSHDVDGDPLTFAWSFVSTPAGSAAFLEGADTVHPAFVVDRSGEYVVQLVVDDGVAKAASAPDTVVVSTLNSAPVADAGPDQTMYVTDTVVLDGSGSRDVDGDPLTFAWSFVSTPAGSVAVLEGADTVHPAFVIDRSGEYVVQLIVDDGVAKEASVPDTVVVSTLNSAPVADAGPDQTAYVTDTVILDGSGSRDVDGDPLTFAWGFVSTPAGSLAVLEGADTVHPTFDIDMPGEYVVQLIVDDGASKVASAPDTVVVSTLNSAPVADAGPDQTVYVEDTVALDGGGSHDVDGDPLTFAWSFMSRPAGSATVLEGADTVHPTFVVDMPGEYVVQLIVDDGVAKVAGVPDPVIVEAYGRPEGLLQVFLEPAAARACGARWRVDGGAWRESGDTVTVVAGEHTVSFSDIVCEPSGCFGSTTAWNTPQAQAVTVVADETRQVTGTYTPSAKTLTAGFLNGASGGSALMLGLLAVSMVTLRGRRRRTRSA